jgi:hypothetical protein
MALSYTTTDWIWERLAQRYAVTAAAQNVEDVFLRWQQETPTAWGYQLIDFYTNATGISNYADAAYAYWSGGPLVASSLWLDASSTNAATQSVKNFGDGANMDARLGSATGVDTNDPVLLPHSGTNYLYLPAVNNNDATTPTTAPLQITGDIELLARVSIDSTGTFNGIMSNQTTATSGGYWWYLQSPGAMTLRWSTGTAEAFFSSGNTVWAAGMVAGKTYWLRAVLDVDNGASGHQVSFYWAPDSVSVPTTWTAMSQPAAGVGVTSIGASVQPLHIGAFAAGSSVFNGGFYRAIIRNGIGGTTVLDADFTTGITSGGQTSFTESSVNAATITINRALSGRKSVAVVRPVWLFGTDDYMEVAADPNGAYLSSNLTGTAYARSLYTAFITSTATAGAATTLDDTTQTWTVNTYANISVRITGGTGAGQVRRIASNTATQLTVTAAWATIPDATSTYVVESNGNFDADCEIVMRCTWSTASSDRVIVSHPYSTGGWFVQLLTTGRLGLGFSTEAAPTTLVSAISAIPALTENSWYWFKVTRDSTTGVITFYYAADQTTEPSVWTTISSSTNAAGRIAANTANITFALYTNLLHKRIIVRSAIGGPVIADWAAYGHSASGGAYTDFYRNTWQLTNCSIVNANPCNFGPNDPFSIVVVRRGWATFPASASHISKWGGQSGFNIRNGFGTPIQSGIALNSDALTSQFNAVPTSTAGALEVLTFVNNVVGVAPTLYNNTTAFSGVVRTVGSVASDQPLAIGRGAAGGAYNDFELVAVAVIPKALTATDVAAICKLYGTA